MPTRGGVSGSPRTAGSAGVLAQRLSGKRMSTKARSQALQRPGPRPAAEPENSGHKPGLISNDARGKVGGTPTGWSPPHLGGFGHEALGGTLVRPQKRHGRQWIDSAPGPQPSTQVRGSRPWVGVGSAARGRSHVVARLRVLWNHTSPVDGTATPGRYGPVKSHQGREAAPGLTPRDSRPAVSNGGRQARAESSC